MLLPFSSCLALHREGDMLEDSWVCIAKRVPGGVAHEEVGECPFLVMAAQSPGVRNQGG